MSILTGPFGGAEGTIVLTGRNRKRIAMHLTEEEVETVFLGESSELRLRTFFQLALPTVTAFYQAIIIAILVTVVIVTVVMATHGNVTVLHSKIMLAGLGFSIITLIFHAVKAWNEHVENTRHARAIAALYACKAFRPYRKTVVAMSAMLYGYFDPSVSITDKEEK